MSITVLRDGIQKTSSPEIYLALSQALQRQENNLEQAIAICKKTPSREAYLALSQALLKKEKTGLDEAIAVLREGKKTLDSEVYLALSKALILREKSLEKASVMLRQGIKKIPNDTSLSQALPRAIDKRNNGLNEALAVLKTGTKKFPDHPGLYITLCQLLMLREKTLDKGTTMLHESIKKFPNAPRVYMALSQALLSQENDLEKSIAILRQGIQNAPEIYTSLRETLLNQENTLEKAIAMWQAIVVRREGIERAPDPDVYRELNQALLSESKNDGFADTIAALREDLKKRNNLSNFCKIVEDYFEDIDLRAFVEKYYSEIAESNEREINAFLDNLDRHDHTELAVNLLDQINRT